MNDAKETWPVHRSLLWLMVFAAFAVLAINMGVRQSMGLLLPDLGTFLQWGMADLTTSFAVQNMVWGLVSPLAGILAERYGTAKILSLGALLYAGGLAILTQVHPESEYLYNFANGLLVGIGIGATTYPIVLAAIGKRVGAASRSLVLGIVSAGGSAGQFFYALITQHMILAFGWSGATLGLAISCLAILPLALLLKSTPERSESKAQAASHLSHNNGRWPLVLLSTGFFVCGFHVAFISIHFPTYLRDCGLSTNVAGGALAVIGLLNIVSTVSMGWLGARFSKPLLLLMVYLARGLSMLAFFLTPVSPSSVYLFSVAMGLLWLCTVPLTSGLIADIYGVGRVASHFGLAMMFHQIGAFFGVWLVALNYDQSSSYELSWYFSAAVGFAAALVHLPMLAGGLRWAGSDHLSSADSA